MDSEDKQNEKSVLRWIPTIPISAVYGGAKNVVTAGSQGALYLTKYCGMQVWWIGGKCGQTAMLALSPGRKAVESAHSIGKQALSVSGQYGKTVLSTLWPGTLYVKIPVYVVYESGKALFVEGYKSGKVNAIYYRKLGYNIGGNIGWYLGPIVGFSIEHAVLSSIPAPVEAFSLMTPSFEAIIEPTLRKGMNAGLGAMCDLLKKSTTDLMQGTEAGDFREWRKGVYADVGKYCGQIIGGGLGAAGGFVFGGIMGGVMAIPQGYRKGVENACRDACNPGQKPTQSGDVM